MYMYCINVQLKQNDMITEQQKINLYNLPTSDLQEILDICTDRLGLVDVKTACKVLEISRSGLYSKLNKRNSLQIGKHKFPCINLID